MGTRWTAISRRRRQEVNHGRFPVALCPLWVHEVIEVRVTSRQSITMEPCPLYPRRRTNSRRLVVSALCQKRTNAPQQKSRYSITASARASNFQNARFLSSQWFSDKATDQAALS